MKLIPKLILLFMVGGVCSPAFAANVFLESPTDGFFYVEPIISAVIDSDRNVTDAQSSSNPFAKKFAVLQKLQVDGKPAVRLAYDTSTPANLENLKIIKLTTEGGQIVRVKFHSSDNVVKFLINVFTKNPNASLDITTNLVADAKNFSKNKNYSPSWWLNIANVGSMEPWSSIANPMNLQEVIENRSFSLVTMTNMKCLPFIELASKNSKEKNCFTWKYLQNPNRVQVIMVQNLATTLAPRTTSFVPIQIPVREIVKDRKKTEAICKVIGYAKDIVEVSDLFCEKSAK